MLDGGAEGDAAAHRVTHDVGPAHLEMLDQGGDVVGHGLQAQRAVDVGSASVGLQVHRDHLPSLGERREGLGEHVGRAHSAVQQDQRLSRAVDLIVELEAVDRGVAGFDGRGRRGLSEPNGRQEDTGGGCVKAASPHQAHVSPFLLTRRTRGGEIDRVRAFFLGELPLAARRGGPGMARP